MIRTTELTPGSALTIAKSVLAGFKTLCHNIKPVTQSKTISNGSPMLTTVTYCSDKTVKILTTTANNREETFFQSHPNHIYKLNFYNRCLLVAFFASPEAYGYYSALPNRDNVGSIFCSIIEKKDCTHKKYEMNFTFNSKTNTFLELFDLDHYVLNDLVKECYDTNRVERKLRGTVLF